MPGKPGLLDFLNDLEKQSGMNKLQMAGLLSSAIPGVSDALGILGDAQMYIENPEERTALNYGLSGAGLLPFVPSIAASVSKLPNRLSNYDPDGVIKAIEQYRAGEMDSYGLDNALKRAFHLFDETGNDMLKGAPTTRIQENLSYLLPQTYLKNTKKLVEKGADGRPRIRKDGSYIFVGDFDSYSGAAAIQSDVFRDRPEMMDLLLDEIRKDPLKGYRSALSSIADEAEEHSASLADFMQYSEDARKGLIPGSPEWKRSLFELIDGGK